MAPAVWFRDVTERRQGETKQIHLAVCFLTSKAADAFLEKIDTMIQLEKYTSTNVPLERRKINAAADIVIDQLATVFPESASKADIQAAYISAIMRDWGNVETIRGGYMYPKVGITRQHFSDLARSLGHRLYFAGEATNTGACCTVQAAMETGVRAANQILGKQ